MILRKERDSQWTASVYIGPIVSWHEIHFEAVMRVSISKDIRAGSWNYVHNAR